MQICTYSQSVQAREHKMWMPIQLAASSVVQYPTKNVTYAYVDINIFHHLLLRYFAIYLSIYYPLLGLGVGVGVLITVAATHLHKCETLSNSELTTVSVH